MADAELDPTVIKRTQDTLGKYIKKPPLTEKLLKKPPFRFLHDVFKAVIKETGFFDGLYNADELNFENIKDRDDKMRFLQKMIDVVKLITQRELKVRTSKIVAGHEPERTNELLQLMGEIIEKQLNWKDALKTLANDTVNEADKEKVAPAKKKAAKESEKVRDKVKDPAKSKGSKQVKSKENKNSKNATPSPDEKLLKTTKTVARSKEKVLSRQATIESVAKEPKEREKEKEKLAKKSRDVNDKTKTSKPTKDETKRMSPTTKPTENGTTKPTENDINTDKTLNGKLRQNSLETEPKNADIRESRRASNESLPKRNSKENLNDEAQNESKRRGSKQNDELEFQIANENQPNGDVHLVNSAGSRKSSASQERKMSSSAKNRHSGSAKASPVEQNANNTTQSNTESLKSLKTVNEVDILAKDTRAESVPVPSNNSSQQTPPKTAKREPTFTHENSRDSVGSNSNSSTARPRTSLRPPSARPPSARPGAPRRRDKNVEIILQPNDQIKMSNISVKLETFGDLDDDGENLVIIEDVTSTGNLVEENSSKLDTAELEQQGHLVQQILETQKELTQQNGEIGLKGDKDNFEAAYDANARQSSARQMNNLRDIIQTLTKTVNPFGKLMDCIPEDIDAMQLELNMWRDTYSQAASDLKREKSLTESATEPMKNQLLTIEANIKEFMEMIDASRVKVLQNSDKISKMLLEQ